MLGNMLSQSDSELVLARNGAAALDYTATRRPDLILLDAFMPGMDRLRDTSMATN